MGARVFAVSTALMLFVCSNAFFGLSKTSVPKTNLEVELDKVFFEEGGSQTPLEDDEKEYFISSTRFNFFTDEGVGGQIIVNKPQARYQAFTGEWVQAAGEVILQDEELGKSLFRHERGKFGTFQTEVLTFKIKDEESTVYSTMLLIGGENEIIIFALANEESDKEASKHHKAIYQSLVYKGKELTDLKEVKS
jgi:hypothetical protein